MHQWWAIESKRTMNHRYTIRTIIFITIFSFLTTAVRAGSFMPQPGGQMPGLGGGFGGMPGQMPGASPVGPGQMQLPQGGMPEGAPGQMPTEAEMKQAIEFMEQLSTSNKPEDKALLKAIEDASQQLTASMSDKDIEELSKAMNIDPGELTKARDEAKEYVKKQESQPTESPELTLPAQQEETLEPEEELSEQSDDDKEEPIIKSSHKKEKHSEEQKATTPAPLSNAERQQAQLLINRLIEHLESLSQKGASLTFIDTELRAWRQVLRDFIYNLYLINTPERLEALLRFKNGIIAQNLKELLKAFASEETKITVPEATLIESPYKILGISPKSSDKEISTAYKKLKKKLDAKVLEKQLRNDGVIEEDISRAIKLNKFALNEVEEAYSQLSDKNSRLQIDRGLDAKTAEFNEIMRVNKIALNSIKLALDSSVFKNQLLPNFEELISHIAPKEHAQRKSMETAEAKQLKEQEKRARKSSTKSGSSRQLEPALSYKGGSSEGYSGSGYYPDYGPGRYYPGMRDYDISQGKSMPDGQKTPTDKHETPSQTTVPSQANISAAQKIDPRSLVEMIHDLETNLMTMRTTLKKSSTLNLRKNLEAEPEKIRGSDKIDIKQEEQLIDDLNTVIRESGWNALIQGMQKLVTKMTLLSSQKRTPQEYGAWSSFKTAYMTAPEESKQSFKKATSLEELASKTQNAIVEEFEEAFISLNAIHEKHLFTDKKKMLPIKKIQTKLARDLSGLEQNIHKVEELFASSGLEKQEESTKRKTESSKQ